MIDTSNYQTEEDNLSGVTENLVLMREVVRTLGELLPGSASGTVFHTPLVNKAPRSEIGGGEIDSLSAVHGVLLGLWVG